MNKIEYITHQTGITKKSISNTLRLMEEGGTVPFIARYRKEATGNLDELKLIEIQDSAAAYDELEKRKTYVLQVIEEKNALTAELEQKIKACIDLKKLEDLYLPYKSKRKTKAEKARQAGLDSLAKIIMKQNNGDILHAAQRFLSKDYNHVEDALEGAGYIIADWINENEVVREKLRESFMEHGVITAKVVKTKKDEADKYRDYFDFSQRLKKCPAYRLLAVLRGADEGFLRIKIEPNTEYALNFLKRFFVKSNNEAGDFVEKATKDAYKRLLQPSLETETKNHYKLLADQQSISTFAKNLEKLLLAPPLGSKRILALDPGFKSGCKVVCLDEKGDLLVNHTVYPHPPQKDRSKAAAKIAQLVQAYKVDVIAIGDGTASRETEQFIKHIRFDRDVQVFVVREDGASIYSASSIAREEFPQYDVTVRGAVSIGRRLMDPLAELVKIDPKSLGVGQYQHDVNQALLQKQLDQTVELAVNKVGVDLNTASKYLLAYVAGLGNKLAENIVNYRSENGAYKSREELKNVPRLGANAFQQCAGFLRIKNGENVLDNSAVHPENYTTVKSILKDKGQKLENVLGKKEAVAELRAQKNEKWVAKVGEFTFNDLMNELEKPGLDPRNKAKILEFTEGIKSIEDLKVGMKVNGIVTNVTDFGAFVNIGIKENGLIHKTQLSEQYVAHPTDVIALDDQVEATVIQVDAERKRIGLSLKQIR